MPLPSETRAGEPSSSHGDVIGAALRSSAPELAGAMGPSPSTRVKIAPRPDSHREGKENRDDASSRDRESRLDALEARNRDRESRIDALEARNRDRESRIDALEARNRDRESRIDALEARKRELAASLRDATALDANRSAECESLRDALHEAEEEREALRERILELEVRDAERRSIEHALTVATEEAAAAGEQVADAVAQVSRAMALAKQAEARADAAIAQRDALDAELAAEIRETRDDAPSDPSGPAGPGPRSAAAASECVRLREALEETRASLAESDAAARASANAFEVAAKDRDAAFARAEELRGQIEGMREAAHEAVRRVRLEQVREQHVAAMRVGEYAEAAEEARRARERAEADAAPARRLTVELCESKEEARAWKEVAKGLARGVSEAADFRLAATAVDLPNAPSSEDGEHARFWYDPESDEIYLARGKAEKM